jgi:hypothetical protein
MGKPGLKQNIGLVLEKFQKKPPKGRWHTPADSLKSSEADKYYHKYP